MDRNHTHVLEQAYRDAFAALRTEIEQLQTTKSNGSGASQELDPQLVQRLVAYCVYRAARDAFFAGLQNNRKECLTATVGC